MFVRQVMTSLIRRTAAPLGLRITSSFNTTAASAIRDIDPEEKTEKPERKLKEWRKPRVPEESFLKSLEFPRSGDPKPRKFLRRPVKLSSSDIRHWMDNKLMHHTKQQQRFRIERHETLGCDLAAAHFLVYRGGRVKFRGQDKWIEKTDNLAHDLPNKYDPMWQITHIDAEEVALYYEGIENFQNLHNLTWASFKGNIYFDDWCLDKISAQLPNVEYLDVSECPNLSERGMEALYRLYKLKTLIITDWKKNPSFRLTAMMLEDCSPQLTVEIKDAPMDPIKFFEKGERAAHWDGHRKI